MPFVSSSQRKKCYSLKAQGKNGSWNCDEWNSVTPKKLPKKVKKKYQVGGFIQQDDGSDFLNTLAQAAQEQTQLRPYQEGDLEDDVQLEQEEPNYDYEDLQSQIEDLRTQISQRPDTKFAPTDDSFINFLFSEDGNTDPILFGNMSPTPVDFSLHSYQKAPKGFRSFDTPEEGRAALENQLSLYQTGRTKNPVKPDSTLYQAMSVYAPAEDHNDPKHYAEFIGKQIGVSPNTPISQIDTKKWADAITKMEGNKKGNNPGNLRQTGGIATTSQEQYEGLNNSEYNEMIFPMKGTNAFRGLDNGQPVLLQDEKGKVVILKGKYQVSNMKGKVKEYRL